MQLKLPINNYIFHYYMQTRCLKSNPCSPPHAFSSPVVVCHQLKVERSGSEAQVRGDDSTASQLLVSVGGPGDELSGVVSHA